MKDVSIYEVVLMHLLEHRQILETNINMTKFVKKHLYKIYRKIFLFRMHDSFRFTGIHGDYCTCANDFGHIKFCILESIAHEAMATALPSKPCTPQFLSFTPEIHRKIQPSHIRSLYMLPLPDFVFRM